MCIKWAFRAAKKVAKNIDKQVVECYNISVSRNSYALFQEEQPNAEAVNGSN